MEHVCRVTLTRGNEMSAVSQNLYMAACTEYNP